MPGPPEPWFLCGFNISAATKLSALMNEVDVNSTEYALRNEVDLLPYASDFQTCILSGYREAVANTNTPIHLHLSTFYFFGINEDLIHIWALNSSRARSLFVNGIDGHVTIRSQDASSSLCQAPGPVSLSARDNAGPSTRADQEIVRSAASCLEFDLSSCHSLERLVLRGGLLRLDDTITVLPNSLLGLKNLKYLEILEGCKCEALDFSSCHSLERLVLRGRSRFDVNGRNDNITVLPTALLDMKKLGLNKLKYLEILKHLDILEGCKCEARDLSSRHSLERLVLGGQFGRDDSITVLPNALLGLKKLKYLEIYECCKCESLDLTHFEHIESIKLGQGVTLLPLSRNNYKTLNCIELYTTYDGLDFSLFENLNSITFSIEVKVLPKPLPMHNKLTYIGFHGVDFNSFDNEAIHTWCLLNGADPLQSAGYTPVLSSVERIALHHFTCSSTWLRSLFSTLLTLDHRVECMLWYCNITSSDHEVKSLGDSHSIRSKFRITTDLSKTCTVDVCRDCSGLWETLLDQNINNLSLRKSRYTLRIGGLEVNHVSSLSQSLASLSHLETLTMHLYEYIDQQLPPSLKRLTVCYKTLSPAELRQLVNTLSARTQSVECRLELCCGNRIKNNTIATIPPEEYIPIKQELEAREHVEVKRFRVYDRTPNTFNAWSVRDSFVDDGDYVSEDEFCSSCFSHFDNLYSSIICLNRISMRLQIKCKHN